jgi:hypothetical protein
MLLIINCFVQSKQRTHKTKNQFSNLFYYTSLAKMKFALSTIAFAFAASVAAAPQAQGSGDMSVQQARDVCGAKTSLKCCNKEVEKGDVKKDNDGGILGGGILTDILSGSILSPDQCSDVNVIGGILSDQCTQNIACCQNSGAEQVSNPFLLSLKKVDQLTLNRRVRSTLTP